MCSRRDYRHVVAPEHGIGSEDGQIFYLRLSDEQTIKWIAMVRWQGCHVQCVAMVDGQGQRPKRLESAWNVTRRRFGQTQFSQRILDGNLPRARGGQIEFMVSSLDERAGVDGKALRRCRHPQPALGVQENSHRSKSAKISAGSGASKSSAINTRSRSVPSVRRPCTATGISRAIGLPALAMTTSSPPATRARSR